MPEREIMTMREKRPHCRYCGFDGNYHTMRLYKLTVNAGRDERRIWVCDMCGHTESAESMEITMEKINKRGFTDYKT